MSYLNSPRLTFAGEFQADPSTVNNDPAHFNNKTFKSSFQQYGAGTKNGWWNPEGTGNWRLVGCKITSVTYLDGSSTTNAKEDPVIGMNITDANSRVAGKLVDLDSQQQMVSAIWGLLIKIVSNGKELMKGEYETASFTNIWFSRSTDLSGSRGASAFYQSIIKNIAWDIENVNSRYLEELYATSAGQLSIQFTVDRYNDNHKSPQFTLGRMEGSIGPSNEREPKHFVLGRQLFPQASNVNYAVAVVDDKMKKIVLDLGNSLQFGKGAKIVETRNLVLAIDKSTAGIVDFVNIGKINYSEKGWYVNNAGICTFNLTDEQLELTTRFPLVIINIETNQKNILAAPTKKNIVFSESVEYVCADQFVFHLNPGEECYVDFYATTLGNPLPDVQINFALNASFFGPTPPDVGIPEDIVKFPATVKTDTSGKACLKINTGNPGNPRGYIDGQVYGIVYNLSDQDFANCNQSNFISLLVFDSVKEATIKNPTWADIQPIMQQYANLYPLMSKGVFNLADQQVVNNNAEILKFVFSKEKTDPNYMPATRDLSRDKQQMILNYLDTILDGAGKIEAITFKKI